MDRRWGYKDGEIEPGVSIPNTVGNSEGERANKQFTFLLRWETVMETASQL